MKMFFSPMMVLLLLRGFAAPVFASNILAWEFQATVVNVVDPDQDFGDVRLGDNVRGSFRYDLATAPDDPSLLPSQARFTHDGSFAGVYVAIENPRTGEQLEYLPTGDIRPYNVAIWDDPDPAGVSEVLFAQWAIAPVPDVWPGALIQLGGANVLEGASLPTHYDLNNWPVALVYFAGVDVIGGEGIDAQIYSITPIVLGDFDSDLDRDGADFVAWQRGGSPSPLSPIDLADWRTNFGMTANLPGVKSLGVPEPATAFHLMFVFVALISRRRAGPVRILGRVDTTGGKDDLAQTKYRSFD